VLADVPEATPWVAGAVALAVARELFLAGRGVEEVRSRRPPAIGSAWTGAVALPDFVARLPRIAEWPFGGVTDPSGLWHAEVVWRRRVEQDAWAMVHRPHAGSTAVVGAVALMLLDADRLAGALGIAARGGSGELVEVLAGNA
jgi:hypothetical protein